MTGVQVLSKPKPDYTEEARKLRLAVMDMWKAFRNSTHRHAPEAAILFDKFHVLRHLSGRSIRYASRNTPDSVAGTADSSRDRSTPCAL